MNQKKTTSECTGTYARCGSPMSHLNRAAVSTLLSQAMSSVIVSVAAKVSTVSLYDGNAPSEVGVLVSASLEC